MVPSSVNSIMACDRLIASTLPCKSRVLSLCVGIAEFDDLLNQDIDFLRSGWFIFTIDADAQCRAPAVLPLLLANPVTISCFFRASRRRRETPLHNEALGHPAFLRGDVRQVFPCYNGKMERLPVR